MVVDSTTTLAVCIIIIVVAAGPSGVVSIGQEARTDKLPTHHPLESWPAHPAQPIALIRFERLNHTVHTDWERDRERERVCVYVFVSKKLQPNQSHRRL